MGLDKNILLAVDESEETTRVVQYVADVIGNRKDFRIRLFHVLPPLPAALLEFGSSENAERERSLDRKTEAQRDEWLGAAEEATQPVFEKAKDILETAGVPTECLETQFGISVNQGDVMTDILEEARENDFGTIVVGRQSFSPLKELFEHHLADELVRHGDGLTIWVVE
jgi:nucleotide-binding universal stress UspA family protein